MALQFTTAIRNAWCTTLNAALGQSAILTIYSGPPPANDAAGPTGVLLSSNIRGNAAGWGTILNGVLTASAFVPETNARGTGVAGYFRWLDSSNNVALQGTVSDTGGTGDLRLADTSIVAGDPVTLAGWTITAPGA